MYDFSVDYDDTNVDDSKDIYRYLMKKKCTIKCLLCKKFVNHI